MEFKLIEDQFEDDVRECKDCKPYLFCMRHCREWDRISKMAGGIKCRSTNQDNKKEL